MSEDNSTESNLDYQSGRPTVREAHDSVRREKPDPVAGGSSNRSRLTCDSNEDNLREISVGTEESFRVIGGLLLNCGNHGVRLRWLSNGDTRHHRIAFPIFAESNKFDRFPFKTARSRRIDELQC